MRIFRGIDPQGGTETLLAATIQVADRLRQVEAPGSLCLLRPDGEDYQWLCDWAQGLTRRQVRIWTDGSWPRGLGTARLGITQQQAVGLLMLFLAAETARREAQEGFVWSVVADKFPTEVVRQFFVQKQPTGWTKDALEAAARRFHLRHTIGQDGVQAYYVTVYLQFGFTRRGIVRMPWWLSDHLQTAAGGLLLDHEKGSKSFQQLWYALKEYRRRNISDQQIRRIMADSPWVLPEWTDELMRQSRALPDLVGSRSTVAAEGEIEVVTFLEEPRLRWNLGTGPVFVSRLTNLAALDLTEEHYDLLVGGEFVGSLFRQSDETYSYPTEVAMHPRAAAVLAVLMDEEGAAQTSLQVELWPVEEEVVVYELPSGLRLDAWGDQMSPSRAYALLCSSDLEVSPQPPTWCAVGRGSRRLYLLKEGWDGNLQALLEGDLFWTPYTGAGRRTRPAEPGWAASAMVRCRTFWERDSYRLAYEVLGVDDATSVVSVRLGADPVEFDVSSGSASGTAQLSPEAAGATVQFVLGLRRAQERVTIRRTCPLDLNAVARSVGGAWEWLRPGQTLTVAEAQSSTFRFFTGTRWSGERFRELALLEGNIFYQRPWRHPRPLGRLAGYGEPLTLRPGPYNQSEPVMKVAGAVINPGVIRKAEVSSSFLRIFLTRPLEPDDSMQVVSWLPGKKPRIIPGSRITVEDPSTWSVGMQHSAPDKVAIGISYDGVRIGGWWAPGLHDRVASIRLDSEGAREVAAMLRWYHLPLLDSGWRPRIRRFAGRHPVDTLAAWLSDDNLPEGLVHSATGDEWMAVIRTIFQGWGPTVDQVEEFFRGVRGEDDGEPTVAAARRLMRIHPLLLGSFFRSWRRGTGLGSKARLQAIVRELAGIDSDAADLALRLYLEEALTQAAESMQVDSHFVRDGLVRPALLAVNGGRIGEIAQTNLITALGVSPFREFLGLRVLLEIAR